MHAFQHIVSGNCAADSVRAALHLEDGDIVNMADDLAVGPLGDVDGDGSLRATFWRRVFGPQAAEFESMHGPFALSLAKVAAAFRGLPQDPRPCLVWHGSGATEQLTLRRTCHFLANTPREIWSVEILPKDQTPLPPHWCTGVGVQNPDELARIVTRRRKLTTGERERLAAEWRACVGNGETGTLRHPVLGGIETRPISDYDPRVLAETTGSWQETRRIVGNTMGHAEDAMISDAFIFWRIRELARTGLLELEPFDASMRDSRARKVA